MREKARLGAMREAIGRLAPRWRTAAALLVAAICVLAAYGLSRPVPLVLELDAEIRTSPEGQIFYSRDGSFSEERSQRFLIHEGGARHVYSIEIEDERPQFLRLDLGSAPGEIVLHRVAFVRSAGRQREMAPDELAGAIQPISGVQMGTPGAGLPIRALDGDPHFSLEVPEPLRDPARGSGALSLLLMMVALCVLWTARRDIRSEAARLCTIRPVVLWPTFGVFATLVLLRTAGISLTGEQPLQSLAAGSGLMLAVLAAAVVGRFVQYACVRIPAGVALGFPVTAITGQAALFLYVYVRSLPGALGVPLPVTRYEVLAIVLLSAFYLVRRNRGVPAEPSTPASMGLTVFQMAVVFVICVVVADRDLPRLVMLSSDPDVHAFFAHQVVSFGGVPWQQETWGEDSFNYPAGTGVLIAAWAWISQLDVRDVASALSFTTYPLAVLALASAASVRARAEVQVLVSLFAMGLLFAAFMLPLHGSFVHMEGFGRVGAFPFLAALAIVVLGVCRRAQNVPRATVWIVLLVFVLACLNPVNLAGAGLMLGVGFVWLAADRRLAAGLALLAAMLVAVLLLPLLDPYFFGMATGRAVVEKVTLDGFRHVELSHAILQGLADLSAHPLSYLGSTLQVMPGASRLPSILLVSALVIAWTCMVGKHALPRLLTCALAYLVVASAALAVSQQLVADSRYFLLASYLPVTLSQVQAVLVILLSVAIVTRLLMRGRTMAAAILVIALIMASAAIVRPGAGFLLMPKRDYCGGVECPTSDDIVVLEKFKAYYQQQEVDPEAIEDRLLIANKVIRMGSELWLFPSGGGRLAPYSGVGPIAFFYYQGDPDYTTVNYVDNVCERFDLEWLSEQHVRYVLIPSAPGDWCIHNHDRLVSEYRTVAASGDARVIDLTRGSNDP